MNTPTTNYIEIDGEGKYIEDTEAREGVSQNAADITAIINQLGRVFYASVENLTLPARDMLNTSVTFNDLPKGKYLAFLSLGNDNSQVGNVYNYNGYNGMFQFAWSSTLWTSKNNIISHDGGNYTENLSFQQVADTAVSTVHATVMLVQIGIIK